MISSIMLLWLCWISCNLVSSKVLHWYGVKVFPNTFKTAIKLTKHALHTLFVFFIYINAWIVCETPHIFTRTQLSSFLNLWCQPIQRLFIAHLIWQGIRNVLLCCGEVPLFPIGLGYEWCYDVIYVVPERAAHVAKDLSSIHLSLYCMVHYCELKSGERGA